ncbi:carbohydrate kinase family protein [Dactylosporangium sp. NPDC005555]|uniref:carbohydrate kinase family protein n=1 Tax=Dactylosporangium sp. NPDC005555 TaxID=3154889 RepID=UPI0033A07FED
MGFRFDVVGVGALNLDSIAPVSPAARSLLRGAVDWGAECRVGAATVDAAMRTVHAAAVRNAVGGSAYNTVAALARTGVGLRLGYVGVAGRLPVPGTPVAERLRKAGVDTALLREEPGELSGVCLSLVEDGERTLLVHPGANDRMAAHLEVEFDAVVEYLSAARIVHVTSFLDPRTPAVLADVLAAVRDRSPETVLTFDPGHVWAGTGGAPIAALATTADHVLLNERELRALGTTGDDTWAADRILRAGRPGRVVHVKRPAGVTTFTRSGPLLRARFHPQEALTADRVVDATGAGDVYAAGVLVALAGGGGTHLYDGVRLGMALARHKLLHLADAGHADFPGVVQAWRDFTTGPTSGRSPTDR